MPPPAAPPRPAASGDGAVHVGGRPRNAEIDRLVLEVALRHLRHQGLPGLSVAAVAEEAGTTRAAVYRRWSGRTELALAAVATIEARGPAPASGDAFADLVAELARFRHFVVEHDVAALVAVALGAGADPRVREEIRRRLLEPCRARLRACLRAGVESGALRGHADHTTAEDLLTGSWLAHAARGEPLAEDWAARTAAMVWAGCGGVPGERRGHAAPIE
ncbi:TetR/AcrR family transcriptional regulator [Actinomycetospora lutea]|uniref:TetR/AcrR family transcriptional regulator n=1 Tax=Actinomycetospora lutea TaxID=663604 RepID=UPI0023660671|nr:TetR/AcrR family transcriptional regulator [Actinomycetospora lutea]MDD7938384.1 TetR/AcrR family transcriptional regulator [Actinomycetospora lutea]